MPYKDPEKKREAGRAWREAHPSYLREYRQKYRKSPDAEAVRATYRKRYAEMLASTPDHPSHGTKSGYSNGCRCDRCRTANRDYQRGLRTKRKADAL